MRLHPTVTSQIIFSDILTNIVRIILVKCWLSLASGVVNHFLLNVQLMLLLNRMMLLVPNLLTMELLKLMLALLLMKVGQLLSRCFQT